MRKRRSVLKLLANRRSIRIFKPAKMPDEIVEMILEAGVRAPTSLQSYTVIQAKDERIREEIAELCEGQDELIKNAAAVFLICADLNRTKRMLDLLGHHHVLKSDKHPVESILAVFDAGLLVENMIIAAEALGYGSTILDYPLVKPREFAELFHLPKGVTPLVLLCIGERDEVPPLRPRLPIQVIFRSDEYEDASDEELAGYLRELERAMERENYVRKYTGLDLRFLEYLKLRTLLDDSSKKLYDAVEKFLKENLMKF